ncbi:hypothetical protein RCH14_002335 [Massilia sp. MP_M2]|uniref:Ig-like domain-containing protein n=1 Tax=Massilia sp. MP_M2 TaxID=3071713 RepID=UPI00319E4D17
MTSPSHDPAFGELVIARARQEIVFIENNVPDIDTLIRSVGAGRDIVILDAASDGLVQIVAALAGRSGVDAIHIISHGAAGALNLGALTLDAANLNAHDAALQTIGASLAPGGDILLYGCQIGADAAGGDFVGRLAIATGADVAASDDLTGALTAGGDWALEVMRGDIEATPVIDAGTASLYQDVLALGGVPVTVTFETDNNFISGNDGDTNSGPGLDVVYKVGGNDAYRLVIDASATAAVAYNYVDTYVNIAGSTAATNGGVEREVTIKFEAGQVFTPTSMEISRAGVATSTQELTFTGWNSANQVVKTTTGALTTDNGTAVVDFSGFNDIARLVITSTQNGGYLKFVALDDLILSDVHMQGASTPAVTAVSATTPDGVFNAGDQILVTVTFSEAVTVAGGNPLLQLETGTTDRSAVYQSGSGTDTLTFVYVVSTGDTSADLDYTGTTALSLSGATIKGTSGGANAVLTLPAAGAGASLAGSKAIVIDTTAPAAPAAPVLAAQSDTGSSNSDGVTNDITPTFEGAPGSVEGGATVRLYDTDGVTLIGSTTASVNGSWTVTASALSAGAHTITARATDAAGNTSAVSAGTAVTIDNTAPGAPSTPDLLASSDTGASASDNITGNTTPSFIGTAEANASITLYANGSEVGSGTANGVGKWSITSSALDGGDYKFTSVATDLAGNQGALSNALNVSIITSTPATASTSFTLDYDSGLVNDDRITSIADQRFEGALDAVLAAGEMVEVYINGAWQSATAGTGSDSWSLEAQLEEGTQFVEVRVVNAVGNTGPAGKYEVTLDTTAPTVAITSDRSTVNAGESAGITFTFSEDPGAAFSQDDIKVTGGVLTGLKGDGAIWSATFTPDAGVASGNAGIALKSGVFEDLAGNASSAASFSALSIDTLAPAAPSAPQLDSASDTGASSSDGITANNRPTFNGTGESGGTVILYDAGGAEIGRGDVVSGVWSITPVAAFASGVHTVSARMLDAAGNLGAASAGTQFTVDTTAPTVSVSADRAIVASGETATITFTFSEAPGASFDASDLKIGGGTLGALNSSGVDGLAYTAVFTPTAGVNAGTASILVGGGYLDVAGNSGVGGRLTGLAIDTRAPDAPSTPDLDPASDTGSANDDNITGDSTPTFSGSAESGATVRLYIDGKEAGAGVAVDGKWSITSDALAAGAHMVTARAVDAAGNTGEASGALTIDIVDGAPSTQVATIMLSADTGASSSDFVTRTQTQTISGTLSTALAVGEVVKVSVDGGLLWSLASLDSATSWSVQAELADGANTILARVESDFGVAGQSMSQAYMLDRVAPGVTISSNVDMLRSGQSATVTFTFSEDPGASFTWNGKSGDVLVDGGTLSALSGSGVTRSALFTPTAGVDAGTASITVADSSYQDLAGNFGGAGITPTVRFDTQAPPAPSAPALAAASDTGTVGDGITINTTQVIEGSGALANATVRLYDGERLVSSGQADANGHWSITASLAVGNHALSVTQDDAAGNTSAASTAFALTVSRPASPNPAPTPTPTPTPPTVVDGVPVVSTPVVLPGGTTGTAVSIPIVTPGRSETDGSAALADIPLVSSGGQTLLLGQLPVGFGLSSSGAVVGASGALELLLGSIRAATPGHAPGDQGHLLENGAQFLDQLAVSQLVVNTVRPVGTAGADGALVLTGLNPSGTQGTSLVIDTSGLPSGSTLELREIDFAAIVGAAKVNGHGSGTILAGDAASQHLTVDAGSNSRVFAGGGADVLGFASAAVDAGSADGRASALVVPVADVTLLHGGLAGDTASFTGARADFDIAFHNGYVVVASKAAPDAKALVVNVEALQFDDGLVAVDNAAGLTTLAGMYATVFGRQADLGGFEFWADHRDDGVSWGTIALGMIGSSEHAADGAGFNGDAASDIGLLYQALFDRAADAQGLAFWQDALARGVTLEQVASSFVESAEMVGHQRAAVDWDFFI